ncbi:alternative ribosome-rescue factor A [Photobacterium atrarenae]|uniref:alternative ribosome-rescue factor A n=1 Tax=Photobacterium atrarenae TaxID=865757 RepID=UPI0034E25992
MVQCNHASPALETELGRGKVQDNALKAAVTSTLFRTRVEKAKKGKGSFQRKAKHAGRESYSIAA